MFSNKDVVNAYLNSKRSKERVFQLFTAATEENQETVVRYVDAWVKQFLRRWVKTHAKQKFFEQHKEWLDLPVAVSLCNVYV